MTRRLPAGSTSISLAPGGDRAWSVGRWAIGCRFRWAAPGCRAPEPRCPPTSSRSRHEAPALDLAVTGKPGALAPRFLAGCPSFLSDEPAVPSWRRCYDTALSAPRSASLLNPPVRPHHSRTTPRPVVPHTLGPALLSWHGSQVSVAVPSQPQAPSRITRWTVRVHGKKILARKHVLVPVAVVISHAHRESRRQLRLPQQRACFKMVSPID